MILSIVGLSLGAVGIVGYTVLIGLEIFLYVIDVILSAFTL